MSLSSDFGLTGLRVLAQLEAEGINTVSRTLISLWFKKEPIFTLHFHGCLYSYCRSVGRNSQKR